MKLLRYTVIFIFLTLSLVGSSQEIAEERTVIRVLTYNILHGATIERNNDLDVVAGVINEIKPDIIAIQEMDLRTNRVQKRDINTELALKTGMNSIFMKAVDYDGGKYGQSIFSRWTFLETDKVDLPGASEKEPRIAATATIILPSRDTIRFVGTHLDHVANSPDRLAQAEKLNSLLQEKDLPTILAGDLNDEPGSETIDLFEFAWESTYNQNAPQPTFPSHAPEKKIDYIMYAPENRWKILEKEVICDKLASDHCAYLVVLELLPR